MNMAMTPHSSTEHHDITLALTVLTGKHAGAEHPLGDREFLLVGSGDDCEIILTDDGIAPHHCLIIRQGQDLWLRPLDAPVRGDDVTWTPGETAAFKVGHALRLGQSSIAIQSALPAITLDQGATPPRQRPRWRVLGTALSTLCLLIVTGLYFQGDVQAYWPGDSARPITSGVPDALAELQSPADHPWIRAVVGDFRALETRLSSVDVQPTGQDTLARDVQEILRLSGIAAAARTLGAGEVEITGHFGDGQKIAAIVQSRAMRDIEGLERVVAVNLDRTVAANEPEPAPPAPPRVTQLVTGPDPYLVTEDGSRYYPGATLPDGSVLVDVEAAHMVVEQQQHRYRVLAAGQPLNGSYFAPDNQIH